MDFLGKIAAERIEKFQFHPFLGKFCPKPLPHLDYQIRDNKYDREANLALLRLIQLSLETDPVEVAHTYLHQDHQISPEEINANFATTWDIYGNIVFKILVKAMMQMPRNDFGLMKSMISIEKQQNEQMIGWSIYMYELLDKCHFEMFWKEISASPERIEDFTGFKESIRTYVCYAMSKTFQNVPLVFAKKLLGLSDEKDIKFWIDKNNWVLKGSEIFCGNLEEKVKTKKITETLSMQTEGISGVLANGVTLRGLKQKQKL